MTSSRRAPGTPSRFIADRLEVLGDDVETALGQQVVDIGDAPVERIFDRHHGKFGRARLHRADGVLEGHAGMGFVLGKNGCDGLVAERPQFALKGDLASHAGALRQSGPTCHRAKGLSNESTANRRPARRKPQSRAKAPLPGRWGRQSRLRPAWLVDMFRRALAAASAAADEGCPETGGMWPAVGEAICGETGYEFIRSEQNRRCHPRHAFVRHGDRFSGRGDLCPAAQRRRRLRPARTGRRRDRQCQAGSRGDAVAGAAGQRFGRGRRQGRQEVHLVPQLRGRRGQQDGPAPFWRRWPPNRLDLGFLLFRRAEKARRRTRQLDLRGPQHLHHQSQGLRARHQDGLWRPAPRKRTAPISSPICRHCRAIRCRSRQRRKRLPTPPRLRAPAPTPSPKVRRRPTRRHPLLPRRPMVLRRPPTRRPRLPAVPCRPQTDGTAPPPFLKGRADKARPSPLERVREKWRRFSGSDTRQNKEIEQVDRFKLNQACFRGCG